MTPSIYLMHQMNLITKYLCTCECIYDLVGLPRERDGDGCEHHSDEDITLRRRRRCRRPHLRYYTDTLHSSAEESSEVIYHQPCDIFQLAGDTGETHPPTGACANESIPKRRCIQTVRPSEKENATTQCVLSNTDAHHPSALSVGTTDSLGNITYTSTYTHADTDTDTHADTDTDTHADADTYNDTHADTYTHADRDIWHIL